MSVSFNLNRDFPYGFSELSDTVDKVYPNLDLVKAMNDVETRGSKEERAHYRAFKSNFVRNPAMVIYKEIAIAIEKQLHLQLLKQN